MSPALLERKAPTRTDPYRGCTVSNPRPDILLPGDYAPVIPDKVVELAWRAKEAGVKPQEVRRLAAIRDFDALPLEEKCRILDRDIAAFERNTPALGIDYELVRYTLHSPVEIGWEW